MTRKTFTRIALFTALATAIAVTYTYRDQINAAALEAWVTNAGPLGPLYFISLYAIATVLFLPGSVLTLAGGALFGPAWGTLYSLTGATIGATLAFLVARYLAQDWVRQRAGGFLKKLLEGVEAEGWKFVAFVRLVPLFPFNLLNYALGLTRIGLGTYIVASFVFMFPGALAYTYLGYAGREAFAGGENLIQKGLLALALLAVVAFLPTLVKRLRGGAVEAATANECSAVPVPGDIGTGSGKTVTIVIQNAPYKGDNKAWHALRFAGAALTEDMKVRVHLLDDGVHLARRDQAAPAGATDLGKLLAELMECGLEVRACGMSLNGCQLEERDLIPGVQKGSMKALAGWAKDSDIVMTF